MKQANEKIIEGMIDQQETLLIVDNEAAIRQLICRKLLREGYGCEEANNAEQALGILETNRLLWLSWI